MTLQEIKEIVRLAVMYYEDDYYCLDISEDVLAFDEQVNKPIQRAIEENDTTVLEYIESCTSEHQSYLSVGIRRGLEEAAINEGVIREGYERAVNLYRKIHKENGVTSPCI
jgi:hypothetical protein